MTKQRHTADRRSSPRHDRSVWHVSPYREQKMIFVVRGVATRIILRSTAARRDRPVRIDASATNMFAGRRGCNRRIAGENIFGRVTCGA